MLSSGFDLSLFIIVHAELFPRSCWSHCLVNPCNRSLARLAWASSWPDAHCWLYPRTKLGIAPRSSRWSRTYQLQHLWNEKNLLDDVKSLWLSCCWHKSQGTASQYKQTGELMRLDAATDLQLVPITTLWDQWPVPLFLYLSYSFYGTL